MIDKINVRVYATIVKDKKVLVLHEEYVGEQLMKFPGGGLEFGESVLECVQRELDEELILNIYTRKKIFLFRNLEIVNNF